ncbi:MAG: hypothetical protein V3T70_06505 [Phycisphaerae bacterium]
MALSENIASGEVRRRWLPCFIIGLIVFGPAPTRPAVADETSPVMIVFGRNSATLRYATWSGAAWSAPADIASVGSEPYWVVLKNAPTRDEFLCAILTTDKEVHALVHNGAAWNAPAQLCADAGTASQRVISVAYEQQSGDGLIVYYDNAETNLGYRTYNGTTLSAESDLATVDNAACEYLALYARPESDDVILLAALANDKLTASVWNGAAWSAWTTLETQIAATTTECFALAFESQSQDALVVYSVTGSAQPRNRTWNGATWTGESSMASTGGSEHAFLRLAAKPSGDEIILGALDVGDAVYINVWNGSAWGAYVTAVTDAGASDTRTFDVGYQNGGANGLAVYRPGNQQKYHYRTWNGTAWSGDTNGPQSGGRCEFIQFRHGAVAGDGFIALNDSKDDLNVVRWNGTTMTDLQELETSLVTTLTQPFMLAGPPYSNGPRVILWREVPNPDIP